MIKNKSFSTLERKHSVYIPPLNISPKKDKIDLFRGLLNANSFTNTKHLIDQLKQKADFVKQKSLYRYQISKNEPRKLLKKSEANSSCGSLLLEWNRQVQNSINQQHNQQVDELKTFQTLPDKDYTATITRNKHFQRKSKNIKYINNNTPDSSVISQSQPTIHYEIQNKINPEAYAKQIVFQPQKVLIQQLSHKKVQILCLEDQINILNNQNTKLKQLNEQYCRKIEFLSLQNLIMKDEISSIKLQLQKMSLLISPTFIEQNKLENQIYLKQEIIQSLKNNLKYIGLENAVLKKTMWQSKQQKEVINRLEKDKKFLQQKIKIMTEIEIKRRRMQRSLSELSDISFQLSNCEEQTVFQKVKSPVDQNKLGAPTKRYLNKSQHSRN